VCRNHYNIRRLFKSVRQGRVYHCRKNELKTICRRGAWPYLPFLAIYRIQNLEMEIRLVVLRLQRAEAELSRRRMGTWRARYMERAVLYKYSRHQHYEET